MLKAGRCEACTGQEANRETRGALILIKSTLSTQSETVAEIDIVKFIRVTVEEVSGEQRKTLHTDWAPVAAKMTPQKAVRCMLAKAAEKFPEPAKRSGG